MRRRSALLVLLLGTTACAAPAPEMPPVISNRPPLRLAVGSVTVEENHPPLAEANFVDERRTKELAQATRRFLEQNVLAGGGPGSARVTIRQAGLTERLRADRAGGVKGYVTREPTWNLDGNVAVRITIVDEAGAERSYAEASVGRARSIRAGTGVIERDNEARELTRDLLAQLDTALRKSAQENLATYLVF